MTNKMCTLPPNFVERFPKLANLHRFNHGYPNLQHTRHATRRTGVKRTVLSLLSRMSSPKFSRFEPAELSCLWPHPLINPSRSLRRLMSWKSPADHLRKAVTKTHQKRRWRTCQASDCLRGCQWWPLRASAVKITLSISKSASLSHRQTNRLFSEPPTDYWGRQRSKHR